MRGAVLTVSISRRGLLRSLVGQREESASSSPDVPDKHLISKGCIEYNGITCRRCGEVCDQGAIRFKLVGRGQFSPVLDINQCTVCGDCLKICPVGAITLAVSDSGGTV